MEASPCTPLGSIVGYGAGPSATTISIFFSTFSFHKSRTAGLWIEDKPKTKLWSQVNILSESLYGEAYHMIL